MADLNKYTEIDLMKCESLGYGALDLLFIMGSVGLVGLILVGTFLHFNLRDDPDHKYYMDLIRNGKIK